MSDLAFEVPVHDLMLLRIPGKVPDTVLTVEVQVYTVRICEYVEPLFYDRFWCYEDASQAFAQLRNYLADDAADEPTGWKRAVSREGVRRNGTQRVPTEYEAIDATH